jgi:hypothetical protein
VQEFKQGATSYNDDGKMVESEWRATSTYSLDCHFTDKREREGTQVDVKPHISRKNVKIHPLERENQVSPTYDQNDRRGERIKSHLFVTLGWEETSLQLTQQNAKRGFFKRKEANRFSVLPHKKSTHLVFIPSLEVLEVGDSSFFPFLLLHHVNERFVDGRR